MKQSTRVGFVMLGALLIVVAFVAAPTTAKDDEIAGIRKQCQAMVAAWNKHDAAAMAALFAEDGDMICPDGGHPKGRAAVQKRLAVDHGDGGMMSKSTLKVIEEPVRLATKDIAVSDATVVIHDVMTPEGKRIADVHMVNVWKKNGDAWQLYACRPIIKGLVGPDE